MFEEITNKSSLESILKTIQEIEVEKKLDPIPNTKIELCKYVIEFCEKIMEDQIQKEGQTSGCIIHLRQKVKELKNLYVKETYNLTDEEYESYKQHDLHMVYGNKFTFFYDDMPNSTRDLFFINGKKVIESEFRKAIDEFNNPDKDQT